MRYIYVIDPWTNVYLIVYHNHERHVKHFCSFDCKQFMPHTNLAILHAATRFDWIKHDGTMFDDYDLVTSCADIILMNHWLKYSRLYPVSCWTYLQMYWKSNYPFSVMFLTERLTDRQINIQTHQQRYKYNELLCYQVCLFTLVLLMMQILHSISSGIIFQWCPQHCVITQGI